MLILVPVLLVMLPEHLLIPTVPPTPPRPIDRKKVCHPESITALLIPVMLTETSMCAVDMLLLGTGVHTA